MLTEKRSYFRTFSIAPSTSKECVQIAPSTIDCRALPRRLGICLGTGNSEPVLIALPSRQSLQSGTLTALHRKFFLSGLMTGIALD